MKDATFASEISKVEISAMAFEMTELQIQSQLSAGQPPGPESSVMNSVGTEINQRLSELAVEALDYYALPFKKIDLSPGSNEWYPGPEYAPPQMGTYLNKRAASIFGGSDEIQRDIIAKLVLRL